MSVRSMLRRSGIITLCVALPCLAVAALKVDTAKSGVTAVFKQIVVRRESIVADRENGYLDHHLFLQFQDRVLPRNGIALFKTLLMASVQESVANAWSFPLCRYRTHHAACCCHWQQL